MDAEVIRQRAEAHGRAVVSGDLRTAGADLAAEAREAAGTVMGALPKSLDSAEIVNVEDHGDEALSYARYSGEGREVSVESRWAERDGQPKIVALRLV